MINGIKKSFGDKVVLKDCTFKLEKGKIYGLLGRNGAGKTTLFNCLSDEIQVDEGEAILVDNGKEAILTSDDIGYVFSTPYLPDFLTGYEFLKFYIDINRDRADLSKSIDYYFDLVQIEPEDRHRLLKGYSHGMKNKMQMLLFLISRPPVILLDEPLTSFDVVVALEFKKLLRDIKKDHIIIFSTHILQLATDLCDELVILSDGRLSQLQQELLRSKDFEARIIEMLKDEEAHD